MQRKLESSTFGQVKHKTLVSLRNITYVPPPLQSVQNRKEFKIDVWVLITVPKVFFLLLRL